MDAVSPCTGTPVDGCFVGRVAREGRQTSLTFGLDGVRIGADVADSQFGWRVFDRVPAGQSAIGLASGNVYFALPVDLTLLKGSQRGW